MALMRSLLIAGTAGLIACGGDVERTDNDPVTTPSDSALVAPPAAQTPADLSGLDVTLAEWNIQLSRDSVPAGLVSLRVRNGGTMPHRLEVEGNGEEVETEDLAAGAEITMTMSLSAGSYELYCPIVESGSAHDARGMRTRLRVY